MKKYAPKTPSEQEKRQQKLDEERLRKVLAEKRREGRKGLSDSFNSKNNPFITTDYWLGYLQAIDDVFLTTVQQILD